ncbi:MAG: hypothetical protein AAF696_15125 [Bacteroidota bacterium]
MTYKPASYSNLLWAVVVFFFMAIYLVKRGDKPREDFIQLSGRISYLSQVSPLRPESEPREKEYFLVLSGHERVFEMFVGQGKWDFSPRVNRLDELAVGDTIDIYYEDNSKTRFSNVNRLLQYLDKDGQLYYLRSKADKYIGYFILAIGGLLLLIYLYLWIKSG